MGTNIYTYKTGLYQLINDGFNQNKSSQRNIINKIKILTKRVTDTIHAVIPKNIRNIHQPQYLNMRMFWLN